MKKLSLFEGLIPICLLGMLLIVMLATVATQARAYGLTTDEWMHESYGQTSLRWYLTLGKDRSFLNYPLEDYEPEHGAIFDVVVAAAQHILGHQWLTQALITALTGVLGVLAIALCGFELGGWWFAFLAALSLWLYPRFTGAIFNNPKDIPFTTINTFVLWSVLLLLKQWGDQRKTLRNSLLVALFLAIAIAIRGNAITWYAILVLLLAGWWLLNWRQTLQEKRIAQAVRQQAITGVIIGAGSFLGMVLMWPYVFLNPLKNFKLALTVLAKYPWNGAVLYQGKMQLAVNLPRDYAPVWLAIGSPPLLILFAAIGLLLIGGWYARKRILDPRFSLVILTLALPLGMMIGLHSVLYNGLRQFLFLVPPMILLAVYGMTRLCAFLWQRKQRVLFIALALFIAGNFVWTINDMRELHPYEYVYFSPLVGGVQGANGVYEMDYWNTCQKAASQWLGANYQRFTTSQHPTIQDKPISFQYLTYLPPNFQAVQQNPDFLLDIAPFIDPQQIPQYRLIHVENVEGVSLCKVYVNSQID